ncbi:hypothetical protein CTEN210_05021 [Chaetoceros tenuissimus]|uniref:Uncharacterized protein n=1 Tax=Chaetoceros tenuissimus TaxID=426638 RepID=A0AAD3H319_9STRA|nr:hypothetical protein CTEN210_05021 [Chaetoceros tenuissimus]
MKLSLFALTGLFAQSAAFTTSIPAARSSALFSTPEMPVPPPEPTPEAAPEPVSSVPVPVTSQPSATLPNGDLDPTQVVLFPEEHDTCIPRIEGGGTLRSTKIPQWATRVQYKIESFGRPLKGEVQLWLGPERKTHTLTFANENGVHFPIESTLKFKPNPTFKITTADDPNCPLKISLSVPTPERAQELENITEQLFYQANSEQKKTIQGGNVNGKHGQWVTWNIPENVDAVQLIGWSVNTGKKSFRVKVEMIKGPNNVMQKYTLQCGGGSQPYHTVLQTPGAGWTVRMTNLKFMEDGKTEFAVLPFDARPANESNLMDWN